MQNYTMQQKKESSKNITIVLSTKLFIYYIDCNKADIKLIKKTLQSGRFIRVDGEFSWSTGKCPLPRDYERMIRIEDVYFVDILANTTFNILTA